MRRGLHRPKVKAGPGCAGDSDPLRPCCGAGKRTVSRLATCKQRIAHGARRDDIASIASFPTGRNLKVLAFPSSLITAGFYVSSAVEPQVLKPSSSARASTEPGSPKTESAASGNRPSAVASTDEDASLKKSEVDIWQKSKGRAGPTPQLPSGLARHDTMQHASRLCNNTAQYSIRR